MKMKTKDEGFHLQWQKQRRNVRKSRKKIMEIPCYDGVCVQEKIFLVFLLFQILACFSIDRSRRETEKRREKKINFFLWWKRKNRKTKFIS